MRKQLLSAYEKKIDQDIENNAYVSVKNFDEEKKRYQTYFKEAHKKNKTISLRLSEKDLSQLKSKAVQEGIPYQTLLTILLRQYSAGKINLSL